MSGGDSYPFGLSVYRFHNTNCTTMFRTGQSYWGASTGMDMVTTIEKE